LASNSTVKPKGATKSGGIHRQQLEPQFPIILEIFLKELCEQFSVQQVSQKTESFRINQDFRYLNSRFAEDHTQSSKIVQDGERLHFRAE